MVQVQQNDERSETSEPPRAALSSLARPLPPRARSPRSSGVEARARGKNPILLAAPKSALSRSAVPCGAAAAAGRSPPGVSSSVWLWRSSRRLALSSAARGEYEDSCLLRPRPLRGHSIVLVGKGAAERRAGRRGKFVARASRASGVGREALVCAPLHCLCCHAADGRGKGPLGGRGVAAMRRGAKGKERGTSNGRRHEFFFVWCMHALETTSVCVFPRLPALCASAVRDRRSSRREQTRPSCYGGQRHVYLTTGKRTTTHKAAEIAILVSGRNLAKYAKAPPPEIVFDRPNALINTPNLKRPVPRGMIVSRKTIKKGAHSITCRPAPAGGCQCQLPAHPPPIFTRMPGPGQSARQPA